MGVVTSSISNVSVLISDDSLIRRSACGDERATLTLYRRFSPYIAGVVYRMMGNDQELDDIVQETFVVAFDKLSVLKDPQHLRLWLVKIAVRQVLACIKKRKYRTKLTLEAGETPLLSGDKEQMLNPHDAAALAEVYAALNQLPAQLQVPWTLSRVEGLSVDEVAQICGKSAATVKRRVKSASEQLRRRLDDGL